MSSAHLTPSLPRQAAAVLAQLRALGVTPRALSNDSRQIGPGDVFLAYPGAAADGRRFIAQAIAAGASAVLWEAAGHNWDESLAVPQLPIDGLRQLAGELAHQFHGQPSTHLQLIGVTGTNGKTSCSHWIAQALTAAGRRCAVIGTVGNGFPAAIGDNRLDTLSDARNTTPDALALHRQLADYRAAGAAACAMEVSSIGLDQARCAGATFAIAVYTNLTRDHLDYHGSMAAYAAAKESLFTWPTVHTAVLNLDDDFGRQLAARTTAKRRIGYTLSAASADNIDFLLRASDIRAAAQGQTFTLQTPQGTASIHTPLLGRHNISNLLAVAGTLLADDLPLAQVAELLSALTAPPGRLQSLGGENEPLVVIDYAHTPDALENVLHALRPVAQARQGRLWCLFGCGGDRDPGKRPQMGAIAHRLADRVVVTSDNPRHEAPQAIVADILAGLPANDDKVVSLIDRRAAIAAALREAAAADVVLLAGKGHETYQEVAGVKQPFDDLVEARQGLRLRQEQAA